MNMSEDLQKEAVVEKKAKKSATVANDSNSGIADFDWSSLGKKDQLYAPDVRKQMEAEYGVTVGSIVRNEIVEG